MPAVSTPTGRPDAPAWRASRSAPASSAAPVRAEASGRAAGAHAAPGDLRRGQRDEGHRAGDADGGGGGQYRDQRGRAARAPGPRAQRVGQFVAHLQ